ncbi:MAG: ribosome small subunit-dependent GTPase A, partial [Clostridiales bacterium]|nr:ribosome small subunit-dependent GTPase A [Clostridiales bacterium]
VPVLLCVNKVDLSDADSLIGIYRRAGFAVFPTSAETGQGIDALYDAIRGKTVAFTGNSGVGKSSILNRMDPDFAVKTGEVSDKLGRGRHTTRHVELYCLPDGTCVIDTPGFSSFDTEQMELILKENLQYAFPDFAPYLGACRYHDCAHLHEPECAVLAALKDGKIEPTRHESYVRLYESTKEIKLWELK